MSIQKLFSGRANSTNGATFVGERGHIFYDEAVGQLRISDGVTAGGLPILVASTTANLGNLYVAGTTISTTTTNSDLNLDSNGTGNVNLVGSLRILTSAGYYSTTPVLSASQQGVVTVNGNLATNGNLITNGPSYFTGTSSFIGATTFVGAEVNTGNVTINGNLNVNGPSYFVGNVAEVGNLTITGTTINNGLSVFNGNLTITGNTYLTGNSFVIGPTTVTGNAYLTGNTFQTGPATFIVTMNSSNQGAVEITGNTLGLSQPPQNSGVMLHTTGPDGDATSGRAYFDSGGNYTVIAGRRYNGTIANPTQVLAGQDIVRYGGTPYGSSGWPTIGPARMTFTAGDNISSTAQGGYIAFHTTANGTVTSNQILTATIDPAYGVTSPIGFVTTGNITATVNTTSGNIILGSGTSAGNVTQLTNKSTSVTANGSSGTIIMNNANFVHQSMVTFTVNNSYILHYNDLVILNIQNPITSNQYQATVGAVSPGSFVVNVYNNGAGGPQDKADAIVLTFGVIRVGG